MSPDRGAPASPNLDPEELAHFESLAGRWWDSEGEFATLHRMNPLRSNFIDQRAPVAGRKTLDVGCGGGLLCEALAQRGAQASGIDASGKAIEVARIHLNQSGLKIDYRQATAEEEASERGALFDVVTCLELLEHVPDPAGTVKACASLTRPGGHLFFSTINRNPKAWLMAIVGGEYVLNLLPRGTHQYEKFICPSELASWLRAAGLRLEELVGMRYNPLTKTFSLSRNLDVNYLAWASKAA